jgi:hypothetical protein
LKTIVKEYGSTLIAIAVAGVIFAVLGGLSSSLAQLIFRQTGNYLVENDGNPAFDAYRANGKIQVSYTNLSPVAGARSPVTSHFTAVSASGEDVTITLCTIYDNNNIRVYTQIQDGKEYLYPEQPGIYRICYEAVDALGRRQYGTLKIPVQRQ